MLFQNTQRKKLKENLLEWIYPTAKYDPMRACGINTAQATTKNPVITEEIVQESYTGTHYSKAYIPISQRRTISRLVDYHRIAI